MKPNRENLAAIVYGSASPPSGYMFLPIEMALMMIAWIMVIILVMVLMKIMTMTFTKARSY